MPVGGHLSVGSHSLDVRAHPHGRQGNHEAHSAHHGTSSCHRRRRQRQGHPQRHRGSLGQRTSGSAAAPHRRVEHGTQLAEPRPLARGRLGPVAATSPAERVPALATRHVPAPAVCHTSKQQSIMRRHRQSVKREVMPSLPTYLPTLRPSRSGSGIEGTASRPPPSTAWPLATA